MIEKGVVVICAAEVGRANKKPLPGVGERQSNSLSTCTTVAAASCLSDWE